MEMIILILMMVGLFWFMNRGARKAQQKQIDQRSEALAVGNNVVTQAGFLGRVVDIDGDAVTLESPAGDESVWLRTAIVSKMDIPFDVSEFDAEDDSYSTEGDVFDAEHTDESDTTSQSDSGRITNASPFVDDDGNHTKN